MGSHLFPDPAGACFDSCLHGFGRVRRLTAHGIREINLGPSLEPGLFQGLLQQHARWTDKGPPPEKFLGSRSLPDYDQLGLLLTPRTHTTRGLEGAVSTVVNKHGLAPNVRPSPEGSVLGSEVFQPLAQDGQVVIMLPRWEAETPEGLGFSHSGFELVVKMYLVKFDNLVPVQAHD